MARTLHAHLSPELAKEIASLVKEGNYASQAEALRHGIRLLFHRYK